METKNECRCEKSSCGCPGAEVSACTCGASCACKSQCRCGTACGCK